LANHLLEKNKRSYIYGRSHEEWLTVIIRTRTQGCLTYKSANMCEIELIGFLHFHGHGYKYNFPM